jgi:deoxyribodipyrimidine photolyase-related protein
VGSCFTKEVKTGDKACPFNSLYWNDKNEDKLGKNQGLE